MDRERRKDIYYSISTPSNVLVEMLGFNSSYSQFEKIKQRLSEICGKDLDEEKLYEIYVCFRKVIGHRKFQSVIEDANISMADELASIVREKYDVDIEEESNSDLLKDCISLAKFGIKINLKYDENFPMSYIIYDIEKELITDKSREDIDSIYQKYYRELFEFYNENVKKINMELDYQVKDENDFLNALMDQDNEHYDKARVLAAVFFSKLATVYSFDELMHEEEKVKSEINIGMTDILEYVGRFEFSAIIYEEELKNRQLYAKLGTTWNKTDLANYKKTKEYIKRLEQIINSQRTKEEEKEYCTELYNKLSQINQMTLEEVVERKDEVLEQLNDAVLEYQVYIRENMVENIHVVKNDAQQIATDTGEIIAFNGEIITSNEQAGAMLIHACAIPDLSSERYQKERAAYKIYMIQKLKEQRGKREDEVIQEDDVELQSIMKHYDEVVRNPFAVHEMQDKFLREIGDGQLLIIEDEDREHICTEIVYGDKLMRPSYGNFGMIFDKNGITPESIIISSEKNIESNRGIYNAVDDRDSLYSTSASLYALEAAAERETNSNTEIDLERGSIKPSGICYFTKLPITSYNKKTFMQVKQLAEEQRLPLVLIDIASLEREKKQKDKSQKRELDQR